MNRGIRQHHENRVAASRARRFPGYFEKYPGKAPGKKCSNPWCCGNPRSHQGPPPCDARRLQEREHEFYGDYVDVAEIDDAMIRYEMCRCPLCSEDPWGDDWSEYTSAPLAAPLAIKFRA